MASVPFGCRNLYPLPDGTSFSGALEPATEVNFFRDQTWIDAEGKRQVDQQIFDRIFANIDAARELILIDMFLFNDMQGPVRETTRALTEELTQKLIEHHQRWPKTRIIVITDPVNTVYGGLPAPHLELLSAAGIPVIQTPLDALRDSNPSYSFFWRTLFRWLGHDGVAGNLPNPFGGGKVGFRSYLKLINFKANHRKIVVTDRNGELIGLVTSANPHDGSSAHRNVALEFNGKAVNDLFTSELAVMKLVNFDPQYHLPEVKPVPAKASIRIVTEGAILDTLLDTINQAEPGDQLNIQVFYLSERQIIKALKAAHRRNVKVQLILDPNKDAFGHKKNGIPNRPVAHELHRSGIPIRWCDTHGEQCHEKMMIWHGQSGSRVILGSANYTRRNLDNFNLETDAQLDAAIDHPAIQSAQSHFDESWNNGMNRLVTSDYQKYAENSILKTWLYRFMEYSGWSTF